VFQDIVDKFCDDKIDFDFKFFIISFSCIWIGGQKIGCPSFELMAAVFR
jgi:hypothetical protein